MANPPIYADRATGKSFPDPFAMVDDYLARLGLPPPPSVPIAELPEDTVDLALSNRRVRAERMRRELLSAMPVR